MKKVYPVVLSGAQELDCGLPQEKCFQNNSFHLMIKVRYLQKP